MNIQPNITPKETPVYVSQVLACLQMVKVLLSCLFI